MAGDPSGDPVNGAVAKKRLKCVHQRCVRPLGLPSVGEAATNVRAVSEDSAFGREGVAPPRLLRHVIEDHADGPEFPEVVGASPQPDRELLVYFIILIINISINNNFNNLQI